MKFFPITLIVVLASSLFVALILNPAFIAAFMKIEDNTKKANKKRILINAAIFGGISILFYVGQMFLMANLLATVAILMLLNLFALRSLARWFQTKLLV